LPVFERPFYRSSNGFDRVDFRLHAEGISDRTEIGKVPMGGAGRRGWVSQDFNPHGEFRLGEAFSNRFGRFPNRDGRWGTHVVSSLLFRCPKQSNEPFGELLSPEERTDGSSVASDRDLSCFERRTNKLSQGEAALERNIRSRDRENPGDTHGDSAFRRESREPFF